MENYFNILQTPSIKSSLHVHDVLKCTICKNVLIDPIMAPCRCKFCSSCIERYIQDGGKFCPGLKQKCSETLIDLSSDLLKDQAAKIEISYITVSCPHRGCDHSCQLRTLPEHMQTCHNAPMECVLSFLGCGDTSVPADKMKEHLEDRSVTHAKVLVRHISNIEKEMKQCLMSLEMLKQENTILRQRLNECEKRLAVTDTQMRQIVESSGAEIAQIKKGMQTFSPKQEKAAESGDDGETGKPTEIDLKKEKVHHEKEQRNINRKSVEVNIPSMQRSTRSTLDKLTAAVLGQNDVQRNTSPRSNKSTATATEQNDSQRKTRRTLDKLTAEATGQNDVQKIQKNTSHRSNKSADTSTRVNYVHEVQRNTDRKSNKLTSTAIGQNNVQKGKQNTNSKSKKLIAAAAGLNDTQEVPVKVRRTSWKLTATATGHNDVQQAQRNTSLRSDKLTTTAAEQNDVQPVQRNTSLRSDKVSPTPSGLNDFIWRIEGVNGKFGSFLYEYSEPFYSDGDHGYKMCLCYWMNTSGLWLTFRLMRSDDDDRLRWPMGRTVLVELIDEKTGRTVMIRRVSRATVIKRKWPEERKKVYDRPTDERNGWGDGFLGCVSFKQIQSTPGAIHNDAITARCRVLP